MDKYAYANMVFSKFSGYYMSLKKDLPIRPSEMGVLNIITKREGLFTPLMLAELLNVSKPMITAHISVLEKKGYIYKDFALSDRRSFYVMPTEKAKRLVAETDKTVNVTLRELENKLGEDKFGMLVDLLKETQSISDRKGEI